MAGRISYLGGIIRDSLVLDVDAGKIDSYNRTSNSWQDLSTRRYVAELLNSPSFSINNGGGIVFDGLNDYGRIPYNSDMNFSVSDFTMESWFKTNILSTQGIISKDTNGVNFDWCLALLNSTTVGIYSNGTATSVFATIPAFNTSSWYHFVITGISGVIRIYWNSTLYKTQSMSISNASQVYMTIGCAGWNNPNTFFNGTISNIKIYRKGLSDSEILQNYNALKGRYNL